MWAGASSCLKDFREGKDGRTCWNLGARWRDNEMVSLFQEELSGGSKEKGTCWLVKAFSGRLGVRL